MSAVCVVVVVEFWRDRVDWSDDREIRHVDNTDDTVGAVDKHLAAIGSKAEKRDDSCTKFGAVDSFASGGLDDVDVALGCTADDVIALHGEDGGGSLMLRVHGYFIEVEWFRGETVFDGGWSGDID